MSDGSLSQDEIDALLQGSGGMDMDSGPAPSSLSDQQLAEFRTLIQGTVDSQKSNLSMLVSNEVAVSGPTVEQVTPEGLLTVLPDQVVVVHLNLSEGTPGRHFYVMGGDAALKIASPMMGLDGVELDEAAVNALQEALSQVSGPVITALGDRSGATVMNEPPEGEAASKSAISFPSGDLVKLTYGISIAGGENIEIHEVFEASVVQAALGGGSSGGGAAAAGGFGQGAFGAMGGAQGGNAPQGGMGGFPQAGGMGMQNQPMVQSVQFPNLTPAGGGGEQGNIGLLMDVYMEMTVELGRTRKVIKEILGMGEGTIIELDKLAGEPVDILVNHKLIAKGEVVVIDENFGVRVTEIVSRPDRLGDGMS